MESVFTFCLPELYSAFPCNSSSWLPETIMALGTGTEKRQTVFLCSQCSSCYIHSSERESLGLEDTVLRKKRVKSGWEGLTGEKGLSDNILNFQHSSAVGIWLGKSLLNCMHLLHAAANPQEVIVYSCRQILHLETCNSLCYRSAISLFNINVVICVAPPNNNSVFQGGLIWFTVSYFVR